MEVEPTTAQIRIQDYHENEAEIHRISRERKPWYGQVMYRFVWCVAIGVAAVMFWEAFAFSRIHSTVTSLTVMLVLAVAGTFSYLTEGQRTLDMGCMNSINALREQTSLIEADIRRITERRANQKNDTALCVNWCKRAYAPGTESELGVIGFRSVSVDGYVLCVIFDADSDMFYAAQPSLRGKDWLDHDSLFSGQEICQLYLERSRSITQL